MRGFRQVQASQTQQYHTFASSKIQNVRLPSTSSIFNETLSHFCFVEDSRGLDSRGVGRPGADLLTQVLDLAGVLGTASAWLLASLVSTLGSTNIFSGAKSISLSDSTNVETVLSLAKEGVEEVGGGVIYFSGSGSRGRLAHVSRASRVQGLVVMICC